VATINPEERQEIVNIVQPLVAVPSPESLTGSQLERASRDLLQAKVRLAPERLRVMVSESSGDVDRLTDRVMIEARQVNPEFIVNIDAGAIVLFQVLISFLMARFHRFTTMIVGMVIAAVGVGLSAFAGAEGMIGLGGSVWVVALGLFIFAIGEMMASPTSQEYVGRIAPADKKALYMGYYFVAIALGNLFGGILSGELYGRLARDMQRPDLMWLAFGGLMLLTALVFMLYNKFALPKDAADSLTDNSAPA
jgi:MFS family permease